MTPPARPTGPPEGSSARKRWAMSAPDDVAVRARMRVERADPEPGGIPVGPLSPVAVEAFTVPGSPAQRALIGRLGGQAALALSILAVVLLAVNPNKSWGTWLTLAMAAIGVGATLVLVRRPVALPMWVMDVAQIVAIGLLVLVAWVGGPLLVAAPYCYVITGTVIFVVRPWPYLALHTAVIGASYAGVLWLSGPTYAPVTRWVAVVSSVVLFGAFVRWLVSTVARLAIAEHASSVAAEEASAELIEVSRAKSTFLARMSHELRTPLNVILGFSELLADKRVGTMSDRQLEYVGDIATSSRHLVALVDDVLDLAHVETGDVRLDVSDVDVARVVAEAVRMMRERAGTGHVDLIVDVDRSVGVIEADERKVLQVVVNLLANAIKFTPPGGRVIVSARRRGDGVTVSVVDTGVGIAEEDLDRIFEVYERTISSAEGSGLGLPLARRFVEAHGGSLTADSRPGLGSTFTFVVPTSPRAADSTDVAPRTSEGEYAAFTAPGSVANRMLLARVGSWMAFIAAGACALFSVITPMSLEHRLLTLGVGIAGLGVGLTARKTGQYVPSKGFEFYHLGGIAAISVLIYVVRPFADLLPLAYSAVTMTTFALSPRRRSADHFLLVASGYGLVLLLHPEHQGLERYLSVLTLLAVTGVAINWVVEHLRALVVAEEAAHLRAEAVRAELAATSKHKGDFLANMSHELRTPLNAIVGFADLLGSGATGALNAKQTEYVDDVRAAAAHLLSLINDILDLARLEAGQVRLDPEPVAVAALLERVSAEIANEAARSEVRVSVSVEPDVDLVIGDPHRLEQILRNLALNAVKFSPRGGIVRLVAGHANGELLLSVHDNGIGIAPDQRDTIFEAFTQGSPLLVDQLPEGPGLGLSLARGLVELHGGHIRVESEPGRGSTFTVALPWQPLAATLPAISETA